MLLALPTSLLPFWLAPFLAQDEWRPRIAPASDEGLAAIDAMTVPEGFEVRLFAAEPMLANPVCLAVDHEGELYVAETFRRGRGVTDVREHPEWLVADLASETVEDRRELLREREGERYWDLGVAQERIRRLVDADGDGAADFDTVWAARFDDPVAGPGSGLLVNGYDVYFTCVPHLWILTDKSGDGVSDLRFALSSGYGVRVGQLGHDLHGLRIGPDGRLYFTSGDRGFRVDTGEGEIVHVDSGAVLRCELDGSRLEVVHSGLRNPRDLAFDARGDLFTADSSAGAGDRARIVLVLEGADSGWRGAYAWLEPAGGPWIAEGLWRRHFDDRPAFALPPVGNLAEGFSEPMGLTRAPGTAFPPAWDGLLFACDFRGDRETSGIRALELVPDGAGFALGAVRPFLDGALASDCDFGPDGALWFTDWVDGWEPTGKGRVYRVVPPAAESAAARETEALLAEGFEDPGEPELLELLAHADQRVRQAAQFELVRREGKGVGPMTVAALRGPTTLARLHAIWGLGMAARRGLGAVERLVPLLRDRDPEVRAQAAAVLGEHRVGAALEGLLGLAGDDGEPTRVRRFAATALGELGDARAVPALLELLRDAGDSDPVLRHAAVRGLVGCATAASLADLAADDSPFVRLGAVVALRALGDEGDPSPAGVALRRFLVDPDERVVLEAARAAHDVPLPEALPTLAYLLSSARRDDPLPEGWAAPPGLGLPALPEANPDGLRRTARLLASRIDGTEDRTFVRRVMNANYRLGGEAHAWRVADLAARAPVPADLRAEALRMLVEWETPPPLDRVGGEYRDLGTRPVPFLAAIAAWLAERRDDLPEEAREALARLEALAGDGDGG